MAAKINESRRCVIISGAPDADIDFLRQTVSADDFVICADSGLASAQSAGIKPNLIVGDFDSYIGVLPGDCETVRLCPEKDDSDTFHAVGLGFGRGFRRFAVLAATGGRLDHTLANLCLLGHISARGGEGVILSENGEIRFLTVGTYPFDGFNGKTFSVFAFGCPSVTLTYSGAKYPLQNGILFHERPVGLSNVFTSDKAKVTVHSGTALMIINYNSDWNKRI